MKSEHIVSIQQMKDALFKEADSKFPLKITRKDGESIVGYIRGFADQQTNILLISETPYSLGLKILEIKDIRIVEYPGKIKALVLKEYCALNGLKKLLNFDSLRTFQTSIHNGGAGHQSLLKRFLRPYLCQGT